MSLLMITLSLKHCPLYLIQKAYADLTYVMLFCISLFHSITTTELTLTERKNYNKVPRPRRHKMID